MVETPSMNKSFGWFIFFPKDFNLKIFKEKRFSLTKGLKSKNVFSQGSWNIEISFYSPNTWFYFTNCFGCEKSDLLGYHIPKEAFGKLEKLAGIPLSKNQH